MTRSRLHPLRVTATIVAACLTTSLVACGASDDPKPAAACASDTRALPGPATQLVYDGAGDTGAVPAVLCQRLQALQVDHRVRRSGADRVVVELPRSLPARVSIADVTSMARGGRLAFYDWEVNVIGPAGRPDPTNAAVTGGPSAGTVGALSLYDAVVRASRRPARAQPDNAHVASRFYAVDPRTRTVARAGKDRNAPAGEPTRAAALAGATPAIRARAKVYEVKPGTVIVRAEQARDSKRDEWFVLEDDVALDGTSITNPRQRSDEGPGANGQPVVTFEFTPKAQPAWRRLTRAIADRGSESVGLLPGQDPASANQHFTIVLDDAIISTPYIDFRQNPDGIDGRTGSQISGGFTLKSARALAALLRSGPLPVTLKLVATRTRE